MIEVGEQITSLYSQSFCQPDGVPLAGGDALLIAAEQSGLDSGPDCQFDLRQSRFSAGSPQAVQAWARFGLCVLPLLFLLLPHTMVRVIMCRI